MKLNSVSVTSARVIIFVATKSVGFILLTAIYFKNRTSVNELLEAEIANHEKSFNPDNIRDFIDAYILKMSQTTDPASSFYGDLGKLNMRNSMFDLFIAGMDTTATTLRSEIYT